MIKIENGWKDENNNSWYHVSEEIAEKFSESLINCTNCISCSDCSDCIDCIDCTDCSYCRSCSECVKCVDCSDCRACIDCTDCISCRDCRDYTSNPQRIVSPSIGSRKANTIVYWTNHTDIIVIAGCFKGSLEEFERAVRKTHADNLKHLYEYLNFIHKIKQYMKD